MPDHPPDRPMSRRQLLGAGAAALFVAACGDDPEPGAQASPLASPTASPTPGSALTAADFAGLSTCTLLPEQTAGPFPLDEQFNRRDITEGVPGQPMRLGFRVVDAACEPLPASSVEIWHCDATGDYSAFVDGGGGKDEAVGTTFLRGTQSADEDGIVEFLTIVPGWYPGRAVHIHLRARVEGGLVLTSQVYFDPKYLARVYETPPYRKFGLPDTSNEDDLIAGDPSRDGTMLHTVDARTPNGPGTLALLNLGVSARQ